MSLLPRHRPRPLHIQNAGPRKHVEFEPPPNLGSLSPDLQPISPPVFANSNALQTGVVSTIGSYILQRQLEGNDLYKAIHMETQQEYVCKVVGIARYRECLSSYWRVDSHQHINQMSEILLGDTRAYVFFPECHGHLHSYVRDRRRLKEDEAIRLFAQIVKAVAHCHENGIVLRDLKLRKFVFKDPERSDLMLESLDDSCVLADESDDTLVDKHGCPVYVSPEILHSNVRYSGRAADVWSLGVMLYTMLVGRYPFHDSDPSGLFTKIRRGHFTIPDSLSSRAKCLLRNLLRREPKERLTASEILGHPWFSQNSSCRVLARSGLDFKSLDQMVPDVNVSEDDGDDRVVFL